MALIEKYFVITSNNSGGLNGSANEDNNGATYSAEQFHAFEARYNAVDVNRLNQAINVMMLQNTEVIQMLAANQQSAAQSASAIKSYTGFFKNNFHLCQRFSN